MNGHSASSKRNVSKYGRNLCRPTFEKAYTGIVAYPSKSDSNADGPALTLRARTSSFAVAWACWLIRKEFPARVRIGRLNHVESGVEPLAMAGFTGPIKSRSIFSAAMMQFL